MAAWLAAAPATTAAEGLPVGLSAQYPGDRGLARDPRVLLVEDFKSPTVAALAER